MKKITIFLIFVATLISCEKVDFDPVLKDLPETKSGLIMKAGSYRSDIGVIQVESKVATGFYLESKDPENPLTSVVWSIEGAYHSGLTVFHKFAVYPNFHKTSISVTAKFADGKTETRKFDIEIVKSVKDSGPLVILCEPHKNGSLDFWFLWDRRWLWGYGFFNDSTWSVNGSMVNWNLTRIPKEYYSIDDKGWPVKQEDGKYLGFKIGGKIGSNTIVLVSPDNIWVNITGSIYVKEGEPGLAYFKFEDGKISNEYEEWKEEEDSVEFPGKTGDNYFRFNQTPDTLGKTTLFFKLDTTWNALAFARQEKSGGTYTEAIGLKEVEGFPSWGSLEISLAEITGSVSSSRYGPNINSPEDYAENMKLSYFYDEYFNSIRVFLVQLYQ